MTNPEIKKQSEQVEFTLNGSTVSAKEGELLIEACSENGVHIPRFCYHKRMKSVGMCRMCLVEVDTGRGPSLQPSCMLNVTDQMVVETESESTKKAQDGVLEFLLANHPLDCPVCDKGGECPLQDNAFAYGSGESRFVEEKRHYEKPILISDLVALDRERCILCDRCTRFSSDVAGDSLIHFIDRGSQTQVNTFPDHPFSSYYSGNTVQICPVGALTATPYRFKARPWDIEGVISTSCVDSVGSKVIIQSSQNKLVRVLGYDSDEVNWGWLSDKERFIYEANNSDNRLKTPLVKDGSEFVRSRWKKSVDLIREDIYNTEPSKVAFIGGTRLSLESQFAWLTLANKLNITNFDFQLQDAIPTDLALTGEIASYDEAFSKGGTVIIIGQDLKEYSPTLYLRLRHAVVEGDVDLYEFVPKSTELSRYSKNTELINSVGLVESVEKIVKDSELSGDVTVVYNRPNVASSDSFLRQAINYLKSAITGVKFIPLFRRGNSMGSVLTTSLFSDTSFSDTKTILNKAADGQITSLVLIGSDPLSDFPDSRLVHEAFDKLENIYSVDCFLNDSNSFAKVILPVSMFGESLGTFVNSELRLSSMNPRVSAPGDVKHDWEVVSSLDSEGFDFTNLREELTVALATKGILVDWDAVDNSTTGQRLQASDFNFGTVSDKKAKVQLTDNGLVLVVGHKLWDKGTLVSESGLDQLSDYFVVRLNPEDVRSLKLDEKSNLMINKDDLSLECGFVVDSSVPRGVIWAPLNCGEVDIRNFIDSESQVTQLVVKNKVGSLHG